MRLHLTYIISSSILVFFLSSEAATFRMPKHDDVVGSVYSFQTQQATTVAVLSRQFEVTQEMLLAANPKLSRHKKYIAPGITVRVPNQFILPAKSYRKGIVVNLAEKRLYYFTPDGRYVLTYPVALGRSGWSTPLMQTRVVRKKFGPVWTVPASIQRAYTEKHGFPLPRSIAPFYKDISNPLGSHALYLSVPGILIHGTGSERTIGRYVSSGCIRTYNSAIATLYDLVKVNTPVTVLHHTKKVGVLHKRLYYASYPAMRQYNNTSHINSIDLPSLLSPYPMVSVESIKSLGVVGMPVQLGHRAP